MWWAEKHLNPKLRVCWSPSICLIFLFNHSLHSADCLGLGWDVTFPSHQKNMSTSLFIDETSLRSSKTRMKNFVTIMTNKHIILIKINTRTEILEWTVIWYIITTKTFICKLCCMVINQLLSTQNFNTSFQQKHLAL